MNQSFKSTKYLYTDDSKSRCGNLRFYVNRVNVDSYEKKILESFKILQILFFRFYNG